MPDRLQVYKSKLCLAGQAAGYLVCTQMSVGPKGLASLLIVPALHGHTP